MIGPSKAARIDRSIRRGSASSRPAAGRRRSAAWKTRRVRIRTIAEIQDALAEARYKAQFDASVAVRPMRWAVAWRKHLVRALVVVVIAAVAVLALQIFRAAGGPVGRGRPGDATVGGRCPGGQALPGGRQAARSAGGVCEGAGVAAGQRRSRQGDPAGRSPGSAGGALQGRGRGAGGRGRAARPGEVQHDPAAVFGLQGCGQADP